MNKSLYDIITLGGVSMTMNTITLTIPTHLYNRLERLAKGNNQQVADVLLASAEAILTVNPTEAPLPFDLAAELTVMRFFSDDTLWAAITPTLSDTQQSQLQTLTHLQGERTLTPTEQETLETLLDEYDRAVLRRAQALALLALRGHNVPDINKTDVG